MSLTSIFCYKYVLICFFFLMIRRTPRSTRTDTLFPYTTLFRSMCKTVAIYRSMNGYSEFRIGGTGARAAQPVRGLDLAQVPFGMRSAGQNFADRKSTRLNSSH